jgi:serine/threonine-protein kinase
MQLDMDLSEVKQEGRRQAKDLRDELDPWLIDRVTGGLQLVSAVLAGCEAVLIMTSLLLFGPGGWAPPPYLVEFLVAHTALFALTTSMVLLLDLRRPPPDALIRVGGAYQLAGAMLIAACAFTGEGFLLSGTLAPGLLCVWILLFPLFVPAPPQRSLLVSLGCATTSPTVWLVWCLASGSPLPTWGVFTAAVAPYYVCALLAVLPAWLLQDVGAWGSRAHAQARSSCNYQLGERLAQGGYGEVWTASHCRLARPAAIKLVSPSRLGEAGSPTPEAAEALARFEREAQATAALTSPHTINLYDFGLMDDGRVYYAMELLQGLDLHRLVRRHGPISPARTVYLLRQACQSLAEAHAAGLIHRDIKPANLMVCQIGGRHDFVKVLDFGLARRMHCDGDLDVGDERRVVGTPAFMAPELATRPGEVDGRADIYALGCVAYWLLTGRLVFECKNAPEFIADHRRKRPLPPTWKADQPVPPQLERLIMACLAKDPAKRPPNAEWLERRLAALEIGTPWSAEQARGWWESIGKPAAAADAKVDTPPQVVRGESTQLRPHRRRRRRRASAARRSRKRSYKGLYARYINRLRAVLASL